MPWRAGARALRGVVRRPSNGYSPEAALRFGPEADSKQGKSHFEVMIRLKLRELEPFVSSQGRPKIERQVPG